MLKTKTEEKSYKRWISKNNFFPFRCHTYHTWTYNVLI